MGRIPDDKFRIFVSHKLADAPLANVIQEEIEGLAPVFDCWVSGQDIASGTDWNRSILKALGQSHLLLLVFTLPERNWDWCLYEAGLFIQFATALEEEDIPSVVPIFDPSTGPPRPLANVQGAAAEPAGIAKFLTRLLTTPWEVSDDWRRGPLVETVDEEKVKAAAGNIAAAFQARISVDLEPTNDVRFPCHRLVLDAELHEDGDMKIPEDARVVTGDSATTSFTLSLFGLTMGETHHTWLDLLERVDGVDAPWRDELDQAYAAAFREELFVPGSAAFDAWEGSPDHGRVYRPVLYSIAEREVGDANWVQIIIVLDPLPEASKTA